MSKNRNNQNPAHSNSSGKNSLDVSTPASVDLHVHTVHSLDGALSVSRLLRYAVDNNVRYLVITDHNNLRGAKKAKRLIEQDIEKNGNNSIYKDLTLISGVELTLTDPDIKSSYHVLAYDIDLENKALNDYLNKIRKEEKRSRYKHFINAEKMLGLKFHPAEIVRASSRNDKISWNTLAEMAVLKTDKQGKKTPFAHNVDSFMEAVPNMMTGKSSFKKLIKDKDLMISLPENLVSSDFHPNYINTDEGLKLIKDAGANIAVVAHPEYLNFENNNGSNYDNTKAFLKKFKNKTNNLNMVAGIEVLFGVSANKEAMFFKLSKELFLLMSGSSDFHGPHKSLNHRIGTVGNKYHITSLPIIDYLTTGKITFPNSYKECIKYIPNNKKILYKSANEEILKKRKKFRAEKLSKVEEKYKNTYLPLDYLQDMYLRVKVRHNLKVLEEKYPRLVHVTKKLWTKTDADRDYYLTNYKDLSETMRKLKSMFIDYTKLIGELQKDKLENAKLFKKDAIESYNLFKNEYNELEKQIKTVKQIIKRDHKAFKEFKKYENSMLRQLKAAKKAWTGRKINKNYYFNNKTELDDAIYKLKKEKNLYLSSKKQFKQDELDPNGKFKNKIHDNYKENLAKYEEFLNKVSNIQQHLYRNTNKKLKSQYIDKNKIIDKASNNSSKELNDDLDIK